MVPSDLKLTDNHAEQHSFVSYSLKAAWCLIFENEN
jgi:hypothetical protein